MPENSAGILEEKLKSIAMEHGAELFDLDIRTIKPRESIRLKCLVPLCEYYNVCKVCPPNIPGVAEFREALEDYRKAFLVVLREPVDFIEKYRNDFRAELKLADIVSRLELAAFKEGSYQVLGLIVGGCKLCRECTLPGEPCRHPFKARPSPEGFGIDVTELARAAGVAVEWPPVEYVSFLGIVFI